MLNLKGLDKLTSNLDAVTKALESLQTINVNFDPNDPASIDGAMKEMERQIDEKVAPWAGTPFVDSIVAQTKEQFTQMILDRAAEARLEAKDDDEQ
nr:hypothetical protein [uncultured Roseateles sp.]